MSEAIARMELLKGKVGLASQIVEFSADRAKSALSVVVVDYLKQDMSSSAAEHHARADECYKNEMKKIMMDTANAKGVLQEWALEKIKFECARSILSCEKSLLNL